MLSVEDYNLLMEQHATGKGVSYHLLHYEPVTGMMGMMLLGDKATSRGEWLKVVLETPYSLASERAHNAHLNYEEITVEELEASFGQLDSCYVVADFSGKAGTDHGIVERLEDRDPNEGALTGKKVIENIVLVVDGRPIQPITKTQTEFGGIRVSFPIETFDCKDQINGMKIAVVFATEDGGSGRKEVDLSGKKLRALK